eukprot:3388643-Prymnesium_polylepis.1
MRDDPAGAMSRVLVDRQSKFKKQVLGRVPWPPGTCDMDMRFDLSLLCLFVVGWKRSGYAACPLSGLYPARPCFTVRTTTLHGSRMYSCMHVRPPRCR